jgi:hypothetical protein
MAAGKNNEFTKRVIQLAGVCAIWRLYHLAPVPFGACTIWHYIKNTTVALLDYWAIIASLPSYSPLIYFGFIFREQQFISPIIYVIYVKVRDKKH